MINPLWLQRLRHGRGFGVHSPFAFAFITEVLRESKTYDFYASALIELEWRKRSASGALLPPLGECLLLYRVLERLRPSEVRVVCAQKGRKAFYEYVASRVPAGPLENAGFFIVDARGGSDGTDVAGALEMASEAKAGAFLAGMGAAAAAWGAYLAAMPCGMSFANKGGVGIFAALPHLPRQDFAVSF